MEDARRLFVGNLPPDIKEDELRLVFDTYGVVADVHVMPGKGDRENKAAFVVYEEPEAARDAVDVLDGIYKLREDVPDTINVRVARPKGEKGKSVGKGGYDSVDSYARGGKSGFDRGDAYDRSGHDRGQDGGTRDRGYARGFDKDGYNAHYGCDRGGKGGYDRREGYDRGGHDRGHNWDTHERGHARGGPPPFDERGTYSRNNGFDRDYEGSSLGRGGYDRRDYNRGGCERGFRDRGHYGYDRGRYNDGNDQDRYDRGGYDGNRYDRGGYDRGDHNRGGYDRGGYDRGGDDRGGHSRDGDGYDRGGYEGDSYDRSGRRGGKNAGKGKGKADAKLYVLSLPADVTRETLESVFGTYGRIEDVHVMYGRARSGQSSAFIVYANPSDAKSAIEAMEQGYELCPGEGNIVVRIAYDRPSGSGKGGDRYAPY